MESIYGCANWIEEPPKDKLLLQGFNGGILNCLVLISHLHILLRFSSKKIVGDAEKRD
jgi:hypothetical protein